MTNEPNYTIDDLLPDLPNYDPAPADGVRVGESPVPGLTLKRILRGHTAPINRMAWSPDGRFLASPSDDQTIIIWDVSQAKAMCTLKGHKGHVNDVTWSPDSIKLGSASDDGLLCIWDINLRKVHHMVRGHQKGVMCLDWSPNGNILISGGQDGNIWFWNTLKS